MRKIFFWLLKAFLGGALAFIILTFFCAFYYNLPVHSPTEDGATDYSWEKNTFYLKATEGFGCGKTNNEGYSNMFDYNKGMDVDVLIMGSSHMESHNVLQNKSAAAQLDFLLDDDVVYNIGTSGHSFLVCANNFENALKKYNPEKYVVIETSSLSFDEDSLSKAINGTIEDISSHTGKLVVTLQKNQFLRLLYSQFSNWNENQKKEIVNNTESQSDTDYEELCQKLLKKLSQTAKEYDVQLIILYQSNIAIDPKTGIALNKDIGIIQNFDTYCQQSGIKFVNMTERFLEEYKENHILPHGFFNTSVGQGHLNEYGHQFIAQELYKIIGGEE